jgi:hypothetical protein
MVAGKNWGLKGGGVKTSRPEMASTSAAFNGILIIELARTPK